MDCPHCSDRHLLPPGGAYFFEFGSAVFGGLHHGLSRGYRMAMVHHGNFEYLERPFGVPFTVFS